MLSARESLLSWKKTSPKFPRDSTRCADGPRRSSFETGSPTDACWRGPGRQSASILWKSVCLKYENDNNRLGVVTYCSRFYLMQRMHNLYSKELRRRPAQCGVWRHVWTKRGRRPSESTTQAQIAGRFQKLGNHRHIGFLTACSFVIVSRLFLFFKRHVWQEWDCKGLERNLKYDRSQFSIRRARWPEFLRTDGYNELISHTAPAHIIRFLMMEQLPVLSILSHFSLRCRTCMFPPRVTHNYLIYLLSEQILSARNEC